MYTQLFYSQLEWAIGLGLFSLLFGAAELGFRASRHPRIQMSDAAKSQTATVQGAVLGLMGLLAGFSLAMAVSRFDARKDVIIDEANAIGTCYLRTSLLPHPQGDASARMLREYLDDRIRFSELLSYGPELTETLRHTRTLQSDLWREAVAANEAAPSVATGLYIQALNQVIDLEGVQMRAVENHVPVAVLILLGIAAIASALLMGLVNGHAGQRNLFATTTMTVLLALVILIIIDLDRPRIGLITLGHQSLLELRDSLGSDSTREGRL